MEDNKENTIQMNNEKNQNNIINKIANIYKMIPYKPFILLGILLLVIIITPKRLPVIFQKDNYSKIEKICNLATIKAYYHNVADKSEEAGSIGKIFGNIGYKKYWIEYDAIIEYGIDAKKVRIEKPNLRNQVKVYIPQAEVLGEPHLVTDYIKDPVTDSGFLTSITNQDKNEAIEKSIKRLKVDAANDVDNLNLARDRAKTFFEKYIINVGKEIGIEYSVIFEE